MNRTRQHSRVAVGAIAGGVLVGVVLYAAQPLFERYVAGVLVALSRLAGLGPQHPGAVLSFAVAFVVGLSMNFLPCNLPIVMSLLPATSGAESPGAFLRRTALYGLGALAVLGTLGFVLGAAGSTVKPLVVRYLAVGVYVAGGVIGTVGLLSVGSLLVVFVVLRAVTGVP